jgi:hypothetical protein
MQSLNSQDDKPDETLANIIIGIKARAMQSCQVQVRNKSNP